MRQPTQIEAQAEGLLVALKEVLRDRRIGYQAIADAMELSLPSVKRMLNKTSLPLDRLLTICRLADIDPIDVFSRASAKQPRHTIFTAEQDELFFNQPEFQSYFMRLVLGDESPAEIEDAEGLSPQSTEIYLNGLARVGLLERDIGIKIQLKVSPPLGFGPGSKVLGAKHEEFLRAIVKRVLSPEKRDAFALLKPLSLPPDSITAMLKELGEIVDKYSYLSERPSQSRKEDRVDWKLAIAAGACPEDEAAPIIDLTHDHT